MAVQDIGCKRMVCIETAKPDFIFRVQIIIKIGFGGRSWMPDERQRKIVLRTSKFIIIGSKVALANNLLLKHGSTKVAVVLPQEYPY
jgi:hypothetical protein